MVGPAVPANGVPVGAVERGAALTGDAGAVATDLTRLAIEIVLAGRFAGGAVHATILVQRGTADLARGAAGIRTQTTLTGRTQSGAADLGQVAGAIVVRLTGLRADLGDHALLVAAELDVIALDVDAPVLQADPTSTRARSNRRRVAVGILTAAARTRIHAAIVVLATVATQIADFAAETVRRR